MLDVTFVSRPNPPEVDGVILPDQVDEPDIEDGILVGCKSKDGGPCSSLAVVKVDNVNLCPEHASQQMADWKQKLQIKRVRKKFFPQNA